MPRRIGAADRQRERREQDRQQARVAASVAGSMRDAIVAGMRSMLDQYEEQGAIGSAAEDHRERVQRQLEDEWWRAATAGGERILKAAQEKHGRRAIITKEMPDEWEESVRLWIRRWGAARVTQISSTTEEQLRSLILRAEEDGLSGADLTRHIMDRVPQFARYRAARIARTEAHGAHNAGSKRAAEASGLDLVKEWIAAPAEGEFRESHQNADGEQVAMSEPFRIDGDELDTPGDPGAPADQVVNCRCAAGYVEP